ncbi:MAG: class I SAM-dependent methyltransferase [Bacteroidota bacterium]|nr:class I SAM-dependent methyltransferase [Bacteroidota bacterium]MDP4232164.1 class I SAM-dependent methyltransferase [Bacteroidota bacterium]MDP4241128.1 class I SAM-dependent methyltransferase [Bacteroidota bacterium]MDP4286520.1 class I SAM-dependent methyltransferase [Bacteroidota bacterium]
MLSTERFSSRVENYVKYRPHYPPEIIHSLIEQTGLTQKHVVADIGSGTGISSELFLENGNVVYGVEPNEAMRKAGEQYLALYMNFRSIDGTAEDTTLLDRSIDYILAGQAFHWFNLEPSYSEFKRIVEPNGWLVILWNDRQTDTTPFLIDYEQLLLDFGTDYVQINHRNVHTRSAPDAGIHGSNSTRVYDFFHGRDILELAFENNIMMDYAGLEGRLLSSSYVPAAGEPNYEAMLDRLQALFSKHAIDGGVEMRYTTLLFAGQL